MTGALEDEFNAYYANCSTGVAIEIGHVYELQEAVPLSVIDEVLQPPQSFRYLSIEVLEYLLHQTLDPLPVSILEVSESEPRSLCDDQPSSLADTCGRTVASPSVAIASIALTYTNSA
jgi:hypothetical protein